MTHKRLYLSPSNMVEGDEFSFKDDLEMLEIFIRQMFIKPLMIASEQAQFERFYQQDSLDGISLTAIRNMQRLPLTSDRPAYQVIIKTQKT